MELTLVGAYAGAAASFTVTIRAEASLDPFGATSSVGRRDPNDRHR